MIQPGANLDIIFILVDELRWPTVFPSASTAPKNIQAVHAEPVQVRLEGWREFSNYHTRHARVRLSPQIITPASTFTIKAAHDHHSFQSRPPQVLNPAFPTFGRSLGTGYTTPYYGKWHVSVRPAPPTPPRTGFHWNSPPDPTGSDLQGTYGAPAMPPDIPRTTRRLHHQPGHLLPADVKTSDAPFFLTIGYVNPHDREFFPAGTEFMTFTNLFANYNKNKPSSAQLSQFIDYTKTPPIVNWNTNQLEISSALRLSIPSTQLAEPQNYVGLNEPTTHPSS